MPQLRSGRGSPIVATEPTPVPDIGIGAEPYRRLKPGPGRSPAEVTFHQRARIDRAMVEIVAERGYGRATVREIARVAGTSTRAFYEQYAGKEECFLRVHRRLAHGLLRWVGALAEAGDTDDRLRLTVEGILDWWGRDLKVARFLLVGPYGAGSAALQQLRLVDRSLGEGLSRCLRHSAEEGGESAGLITDGIAIGLVAAVRLALLNDRDIRSPGLHRELTQWALSCACSPTELAALQASRARAKRRRAPERIQSSRAGDRTPSSGGDLALLHSAITKLAATGDPGQLTPRRICAAAGVSRRSFDIQFADIDDCLVAAAGLRLDLAVERARRVAEPGSNPANRAFRGLVEFCNQVACDPALACLCFADTVENGEQLARRDRLLRKSVAGLLETLGLAPYSLERPETEASLGAILGLLQNEKAAGRTGCIHQNAPTLAYLMLVPSVGKSCAVKAACQA